MYFNASSGRKISWIVGGCSLLVLISGFLGCSRKPAQDEYLIRVGSQSISVAEFNQVVDMVGEESSAGENNLNAKDIYEIKVRVLNQLTEELIILEKAKAMGLSVTETEIDQAVQQIKADYPDNTFEETLLENAISYKIWRKKLASRLLIEKVIAKELVDQVTISAEDIADYYQKHYPEGTPEDAPAEDVNKRIVRHLRKQKAEQNYKAWIEKLRGVYSVELNRQQWERLINENSETD